MTEPVDPLVRELIEARKKQDISQSSLALLSSVSRRAIHHMEAGGDVNLSTLRKLCSALGVEMHVTDATGEPLGHARARRPILDDVVEEQRRERFGDRERG